jgi:FMN phosphatase YigB (HAD superfamily)
MPTPSLQPTDARISDVVFLLDVDNTLLDNDQVQADLAQHLEERCGHMARMRYWEIFEKLRQTLGYADFLGALQQYRAEHGHDVRMLEVAAFLLDYPFADRLYPGALEAAAYCRRQAKAVVLSDGDVVFQPWKVRRSGIDAAVAGDVLIYIHKEQMLADVEQRYPARHYVMVDDKLRILDAMKRQWGRRLSTVFVKQGHYALDPAVLRQYPSADRTLERISALPECAAALLSEFGRTAPARE